MQINTLLFVLGAADKYSKSLIKNTAKLKMKSFWRLYANTIKCFDKY